MRAVFSLVLFVALAHGAFSALLPVKPKAELTPFAFEPEIQALFDCLQRFLEEYYRVAEIPEVRLNFDELLLGDIRGYLNLDNLVITDPSLASLRGLVGTITILPPAFILTGSLDLYDISATTLYAGNMVMEGIPMSGQGSFRARILDFTVNIQGRYGLIANPPFTDLTVSLNAGPSEGYITGYVDEAETQRVTDIINNLNEWIQLNAAQINAFLGRYALLILNGQYQPSEDDGEEGDSIWDQIAEYCPT